jgi:hypothetical protein
LQYLAACLNHVEVHIFVSHMYFAVMGYAVTQLGEALRYGLEGRGFDYLGFIH